MPKAFFKTFFILCGLCISAYPAFAADNAGFIFSADNNSTGIFEREDVRLAVDHLCRSLSLDPRHKTVKENLRAILSHAQASAAQKSDVFLLEDQLNYIQNLQERINYLASKKSVLEDQLITGGHDRKALLTELEGIQDNISGSQEPFSYPKQSLRDRTGPLAAINDLLAKEKLHLAVRVHTLQNQYDWLKTAQKNEPYGPSGFFVEPAETYSLMAEERPLKEQEGAAVSPKDMEQASPEKRKEEIVSLPLIVYGKNETQEYPREAAGAKDRQDERQRQIVDLSLKLSEMESKFNEKAESVDSLRQQLTEAQQRFILGQRIIEEKDQQLQALQEDLKRPPLSPEHRAEAPGDRAVPDDRPLAEMEAFLKVSRDNLARTNEELKSKIGNLRIMNEKLADVQEQIRLGQAALQERRGEIRDLQRREVAVKSLVSAEPDEVDHFVNGQKRMLMELNAFLNIYRQGLGEANDVILRKDAQIKMLEDKLARFQKRIAFHEKQDQQKDYQIRLLKEKLLSEKDKREQRNINLRNVVRERDETIRALEERLSDSQRNLQAAYQTIREKVAYLNYAKNELALLRGETASFGTADAFQVPEDFTSFDKKLSELTGILDIYKGKLFDEKKAAQEKEANVIALERQLKTMENQLSEKNEALVKTQRYLRDLENELTDMKQELLKLQERSQDGAFLQGHVDRQVLELQSKFEDINEFSSRHQKAFMEIHAESFLGRDSDPRRGVGTIN